MTTKQIGDYGEKVAAAYLKYKGFEIIQRNYRLRDAEIDIIARDDMGRMIFAEVKTRRRSDYGLASEAVNFQKQKRLKRAALTFTGRSDIDMRFDIIEIYYELIGEKISITRINHIKNAF